MAKSWVTIKEKSPTKAKSYICMENNHKECVYNACVCKCHVKNKKLGTQKWKELNVKILTSKNLKQYKMQNLDIGTEVNKKNSSIDYWINGIIIWKSKTNYLKYKKDITTATKNFKKIVRAMVAIKNANLDHVVNDSFCQVILEHIWEYRYY